jgi:hypothetical protein
MDGFRQEETSSIHIRMNRERACRVGASHCLRACQASQLTICDGAKGAERPEGDTLHACPFLGDEQRQPHRPSGDIRGVPADPEEWGAGDRQGYRGGVCGRSREQAAVAAGQVQDEMYSAPPVWRVEEPKGGGAKMRSIGISAFEKKVQQRAVAGRTTRMW